MKNTLFFLLMMAACGILAGFHQGQNKPVLVADQYGVAYKVNPLEKSIYLVFTGHFSTDDNGYFENFDGAAKILKTLSEHNVKGSFFPTGNCFRVERYQQVMRDIIAQGHYLSGHSDRHLLLCSYRDRNQSLVTMDSLARDIAAMEAEIERFGLTKADYQWMIPPYEQYNQFSADALRSLGYKLANPTPGLVTASDWMGPKHPQYRSAAQLINNIWNYEKEHTLNGVIMLIHAMDYPDRTDEDRPYTHLGEVITKLKGMGYGFKSFKNLVAVGE